MKRSYPIYRRVTKIKEGVMKNTIRIFGVIVLAAIIGFTFAACGDGDGGGNVGGGDPDLTGNVTITVAGGGAAEVGKQLTADYSGSESVSYKWTRGSTEVGTAQTYTPDTTGNHTVTVSAAGFKSKSKSVSVAQGSDAKVEVVNNWNAPITEVHLIAVTYFDFNNENIPANGGRKTFSINLGTNVPSAGGTINLTAEGLGAYNTASNIASIYFPDHPDNRPANIVRGKTTTFTLESDGTVSVKNP